MATARAPSVRSFVCSFVRLFVCTSRNVPPLLGMCRRHTVSFACVMNTLKVLTNQMKIYSIHNNNNKPNEEKVRNHFTFWNYFVEIYFHWMSTIYVPGRFFSPSQFFSHSIYMNVSLSLFVYVCASCLWIFLKLISLCETKKLANAKPESAIEVVSSAPCTHTLSLEHWVCDAQRKTQMRVWVRWDYLCAFLLLWLSVALHCEMHFATVLFVPRPMLINVSPLCPLFLDNFAYLSFIFLNCLLPFRFICTSSPVFLFSIWLLHCKK